MSKYLELLEAMEPQNRICGLGRILQEEGQAKHDIVLETIFAIDPKTGKMHSTAKLAAVFKEEYGWSDYFYRRHRDGKCVACLNRTDIPKS